MFSLRLGSGREVLRASVTFSKNGSYFLFPRNFKKLSEHLRPYIHCNFWYEYIILKIMSCCFDEHKHFSLKNILASSIDFQSQFNEAYYIGSQKYDFDRSGLFINKVYTKCDFSNKLKIKSLVIYIVFEKRFPRLIKMKYLQGEILEE